MAIEINTIEDYRSVEIIGLEPQDRAPNDYLRFVARVFAGFKKIDPNTTISAYIDGFEIDTSTEPDKFKFYIHKGTAFVDDQLIAFKDDVILYKDKGSFVNNIDYWLVLYYQYSDSYPGPVPVFKFIAENSYDPKTMLKLLRFKVKGVGRDSYLETYSQDLDAKYMDNFPKLFELVEKKMLKNAEAINHHFTIRADQLYVNNVNPELSVKSGDLVYLDQLDMFYKPARGCNKEYDKVAGFYLYNRLNNSHYIITGGYFKFDATKYTIDPSNSLLNSLEIGKSYYLLDSCSENTKDFASLEGTTLGGKISTQFFPGTVRVGYAITNDSMIVNIDYSADMNVWNILEIIGLPNKFRERFEQVLNYYTLVAEKDELVALVEEFTTHKETWLTKKVNENNDKDANTTKYNTYKDKYDTTLLLDNSTDTPDSSGNNVVAEIKKDTLESDQYINLVDAAVDNGLKLGAWNYLNLRFTNMYNELSTLITNYKTILTTTKSNLTSLKTNLSAAATKVTVCRYISNDSKLITTDDFKIKSVQNGTLDSDGEISHTNLKKQDITINDLPAINGVTPITALTLQEYSYACENASDNEITKTSYTAGNNYTIRAVNETDATIGHTAASDLEISQITYNVETDDTPQWTSDLISNTMNNIDVLNNKIDTIKSYMENGLIKINNIKTYIDKDITNYNSENLSSQISTFDSYINGTNPDIKTLLYSNGFDEDGTLSKIIKEIIKDFELIYMSSYYATDLRSSYVKDIYNILPGTYHVDYIFRIIKDEALNIKNAKDYLSGISTDSTITTTKNNIKKFITERNTFIRETKVSAFDDMIDYQTKIIMNDINIEFYLQNYDDFDQFITNINLRLNRLTRDIEEASTSIIAKIRQEYSMHDIFSLSNYERKMYNYTYITIRLRLKYKIVNDINNNINLINDKLIELRAQPVPDYDRIHKFEDLKNSYTNILNSLNREIESLVLEYNKIRSDDLGLDPIRLGDQEFSDNGYANPNLECFMVTQ